MVFKGLNVGANELFLIWNNKTKNFKIFTKFLWKAKTLGAMSNL